MFEETHADLGVETQRQWSDKATRLDAKRAAPGTRIRYQKPKYPRISAQQLSQPLRLGHLRGDPRRLLRCLERPHGQIRGHRLNWNERMGTGQNLERLVLAAIY
jgi:hypothetical protein